MKPSLPHGLDSADSALAWFRNRIPMPDALARTLDARAKRQAFWMAGVTQLRLVNDVMDAMEDAIDNGTTLEDFKDEVGDKLTAAWDSDEPYRIENVFRTNVQRAYMAGRMAEIRDPVVQRIRPFLRFDSILDDGTCPICSGNDQVTLSADDAFWASHTPPLHFQCRCTLVSLTSEDLDEDELGLNGNEPDAHEGFGMEPDLDAPPDDLDWADPELRAQGPRS